MILLFLLVIVKKIEKTNCQHFLNRYFSITAILFIIVNSIHKSITRL